MLDTFQKTDKVFYMIIGVIGVPVNLVTVVILSRGKCGLSTGTTRYLVAMAVADILVIITEVILNQISWYYFPVCFLDLTHVCRVNTVLRSAARDSSVWFTVTFSFDRFVAICCQKLRTKYCTARTAAVVLATTCILLCLKNVPSYFTYNPRFIIGNVPWLCVRKPNYFTNLGWLSFKWFGTVLTPLLPFILILLLNTLTVRHILVASRVRKVLRSQCKSENRSDPEMENRRKSAVLLFTISGSFILLWAVFVLYFFDVAIQLDEDSFYIFEQVGLMLRNLNCCTNTFIYGATQSKFRAEIKRSVKYPVTSFIRVISKQKD